VRADALYGFNSFFYPLSGLSRYIWKSTIEVHDADCDFETLNILSLERADNDNQLTVNGTVLKTENLDTGPHAIRCSTL
jgi:hypothetical protein